MTGSSDDVFGPVTAVPASTDKLTDKQRAFVTEYLVDLNGTQAATRAGYSVASARQIASENLSKPDIAEAIDRALAERSGVTRTRIVDELAAIGFADIRKVVSWRPELTTVEVAGDEAGPAAQVLASRVTVLDSAAIDQDTARAIAEVSQGATGALRIKMHDKPAALEKLARTLGMFKERVELTGRDGGPLQVKQVHDLSDDELAAIAGAGRNGTVASAQGAREPDRLRERGGDTGETG